MSGIDKSIVTESRLVVAQDWGVGEGMGRVLNGYEVAFWGDEMFWN